MIPLRPLGVGEILDGAFQAIRHNVKAMLGSSAAVVLTTGVFATLITLPITVYITKASYSADPGDMGSWRMVTFAVSLLVVGFINGIVMLLLNAMISTGVGQAVMGRGFSMRQLWDAIRPATGRIIGAALLTMLAIFGGWALLLFLGVMLIMVNPTAALIFMGIGGLLMVFVTIFIMVRVSLTIPALVLEGIDARTALRRSWRLTGPSFWRILGVLALGFVITGFIGFIIQIPTSIISGLTNFGGASLDGEGHVTVNTANLVLSTLIGRIGSLLSSVVTAPLMAGIATLLYLDTRMRQEGLDVTLNEQAQQELSMHQGYGVQ